MPVWRLGLCLGLAWLISGCGKEQSKAPAAPDPAPVSAAPHSAVAAQQPPPANTAAGPSKITRLNEDGSETVEEITSDSGAHNPLLAAVASTVAATSATAAAASSTVSCQTATTFTCLVPAQPTAVQAGQVEVLEFFWYACPHCYSLDPAVETWLKNKPAWVIFSRVPVMWSEGHRSLARLFYTLQELGKLNELHGEVFREIHVNGDPLTGDDPNNALEAERIQTAFLKRHGIPEDDFKKAYHSFAVDADMQKADQLVQRYRISGVPTFVVNGKYIADVASAQGPDKLIALLGELTASEHQR